MRCQARSRYGEIYFFCFSRLQIKGNFCKGCGASLASQAIQKRNTDQCPHCKNDVKSGDESVINAGQAYHRKCWDIVKGEQQVKCTCLVVGASQCL